MLWPKPLGDSDYLCWLALEVDPFLNAIPWLLLVNQTDLVGKTIPVTRVDHPTEEQINVLHQKYIEALQELYDTHKDEYHSYRKRELQII